MLLLGLLFAFFAIFVLLLAFMPIELDSRPKLNLNPVFTPTSPLATPEAVVRPRSLAGNLFAFVSRLAFINKPLAVGPLGRRITHDLAMAKTATTTEEFLLIKELLFAGTLMFVFMIVKPSMDMMIMWVSIAFGVGYYLPEMMLKAKIKKVKDELVRDLPDTVDLLGLCVNAGLDFMMALKYVVEKSQPSVIVDELRAMMQEINVGKPRRDALRDMSRKYELPDLSTFTRTLIQADRMGTSMTDALNILSEDMRLARFRRGEALAMKAPMKMLIPLLFFIFPVVAVLVAGPVFLDFFQNNPLQGLAK